MTYEDFYNIAEHGSKNGKAILHQKKLPVMPMSIRQNICCL